MSPHTVTGHFCDDRVRCYQKPSSRKILTTGCTLDSSWRTSRAWMNACQYLGSGLRHATMELNAKAARGSSPPYPSRGGRNLSSSTRNIETHLLAESLNIDLRQLLAAHQALNPTIQGRNSGGLEGRRGQVSGSSPDVLHICIHVRGLQVTKKVIRCFRCSDGSTIDSRWRGVVVGRSSHAACLDV